MRGDRSVRSDGDTHGCNILQTWLRKHFCTSSTKQLLSGFWGPFIISCLNSVVFVCCILQCRWGSEALCDLQHCPGLWLCGALQPVQLTEGAGAPLPADIPRSAQRLPQRQACLPCPRTDALLLQIKWEWEERWLSSIFSYSFIRLWGHSFYVDCLFCTRSDSVNVKWRGRAAAVRRGCKGPMGLWDPAGLLH